MIKRAKKLKEVNAKDIDPRLGNDVYVNEHLTPYYSALRYACKLLHNLKLILEFWSSGHKVKLKDLHGVEHMITHKNDLIKVTNFDLTDILKQCNL